MARRIIQIIPAIEWYALYGMGEGDEPHWTPIACWALCKEDNGEQVFVGVDPNGGFSDQMSPFMGYEHKSNRPLGVR